ncbi:hypothetical protein GCM10011512_01630 [Tersicoccus solisilvae]|uniref:TetR family transcriptional regulator n=1 Tax=Tersicoccus solisilvae TaxID=1882339 RepID=A0ABQ1NJ89_9MICC|nr:hypothetical protein [Tersicoccus solisilvae]GGC78697.1 hypothetical protein GCM10011512_01630 [Tersicoccus solisilvae]
MTPTHAVTWPAGRLIILAGDARETEAAWLPTLLAAVGTPGSPPDVERLAPELRDDVLGRRRRLRELLLRMDESTFVVAFNSGCTTVLEHLVSRSDDWRLGGLLLYFDQAFAANRATIGSPPVLTPALASLRARVTRRIVASAPGRTPVPAVAAAELARLLAAEYHALTVSPADADSRAAAAAALAPLLARLTAPEDDTPAPVAHGGAGA